MIKVRWMVLMLLVLVRLGQAADAEAAYLPSFETLLKHQPVRLFLYGEDGEITEKIEYSACLQAYIDRYIDKASGLYPLTQELEHIIRNVGTFVGWWEESSYNYLFNDEFGQPIDGINPELAWLFSCVYMDEME